MAGHRLRKFFKSVFIGLNLLVSLVFLLACLAHYLNPAGWWPAGFLALIVPYLVILLIFSVIFWLIIKPKFVFIPLISLLLGSKQLQVLLAWHPSQDFAIRKRNHTIRIADWNVASMYGLTNNGEIKKHNRLEIAGLLLKQNADVLCLQEFNHSYTQGPQADNIDLFTAQYPYYFYSRDYDKENGFYTAGSIIFSRFPILDSGKIRYPGRIAESFIYVDIKAGSDTIRIYTVHLQSYRFTGSDYLEMQRLKEEDNNALSSSRSLIQKMKEAFIRRGIQAETIHTFIEQSPYPSVVAGDFNDVPNSYTYFHIRGNRQDAFLARGFGIGRTYISLAPTLRIDYILPDNRFNVEQFSMVDEGLSDHVMLVTDLTMKK